MELTSYLNSNGLYTIDYINGEWATAIDVSKEDMDFCMENFYKGGYELIAKKYGWF